MSVTGGEAGAIPAPEYEIKGATAFDQRWIDEVTESGVRGLGWERPKPRPVEWDNPSTTSKPTASVVKPPKKKGFFQRFRRKQAVS